MSGPPRKKKQEGNGPLDQRATMVINQNVGRTIPLLPYFLQIVGEMRTIHPIDEMSGEMAPFLRSCASFSLPPGGASAHMTSDKDQACLDVYVITLPKPVIGSVNKMSG